MSLGTEIFTVIKKIFVVSDEVTRLSGEVKELTRMVNNHDVRIAVLESTLAISLRSGKLTLPGN